MRALTVTVDIAIYRVLLDVRPSEINPAARDTTLL